MRIVKPAPSLARRIAVVLAVAVVSAVLATPAGAQAANESTIFGVSSAAQGNETQISAIENLEEQLGTQLPLVRVFESWDSSIDNRYNNWIVDGGRRIMMSIKPRTDAGDVISWNRVANAAPGSALHDNMVRLAREVKALDAEVWLAFHHEPEAQSFAWGEPDDFQAAWRNLHSVFEQEGADVEWVWTMTGWSYQVVSTDRRAAAKWYPGDDYVDYVGADIYNWNQCRTQQEGWRSLKDPLDPVIAFADARGKQTVLPEIGVHADGPAKAQWLDDVRSLLKQSPYAEKVAGVIYYDSIDSGAPNCNWPLDSSSESLSAARRIVTDPFFRGDASGATCGGETATIVGTAGDDVLRGTSGVDVIAGKQGNDVIYGFGGDDILCGGLGDDTLLGGPGFDILYGAQGDDSLYAATAADRTDTKGARMFGGADDDTIVGSNRWDRVQGGDGNDTISTFEGRDWIRAGKGNDRITPGGSIDDVHAGTGRDWVSITSGDSVRAGIGIDTCVNASVAARAWGCER